MSAAWSVFPLAVLWEETERTADVWKWNGIGNNLTCTCVRVRRGERARYSLI